MHAFSPEGGFLKRSDREQKRLKNKIMNDLDGIKMKRNNNKKGAALPVLFLNREGEPEMPGSPGSATPFGADAPAFSIQGDGCRGQRAILLPQEKAMNRLQRALFETGQLCVTTHDGLVRVCFSGMGDPERLFVESVPRDVAVPAVDCDFPGCLCSLEQAEKILRRIYRGESSSRLEALLDRLAHGRRKQQQTSMARRLRAA